MKVAGKAGCRLAIYYFQRFPISLIFLTFNLGYAPLRCLHWADADAIACRALPARRANGFTPRYAVWTSCRDATARFAVFMPVGLYANMPDSASGSDSEALALAKRGVTLERASARASGLYVPLR